MPITIFICRGRLAPLFSSPQITSEKRSMPLSRPTFAQIFFGFVLLAILPACSEATPEKPISAMEVSDTYFSEALAAHQEGDNATAADLLGQALDLRPNYPRMLSVRAQVQTLPVSWTRPSPLCSTSRPWGFTAILRPPRTTDPFARIPLMKL